MLYKNPIISSTFIAAVAFFVWMFGSLHNASQMNAAADNIKPDAFMENVNATVMNKFGKPSLKITTPKMIHFNANDASELTSPKLVIYRNSPEPWHISSNYANATQGIDNVLFKDNVIIQHLADNRNPATVIKTLSLMVHPNQKTAETSDDITMIQPSTVIKATGMQADMNLDSIKLLSQARGEYVPSS